MFLLQIYYASENCRLHVHRCRPNRNSCYCCYKRYIYLQIRQNKIWWIHLYLVYIKIILKYIIFSSCALNFVFLFPFLLFSNCIADVVVVIVIMVVIVWNCSKKMKIVKRHRQVVWEMDKLSSHIILVTIWMW